MMKFIDNAFDRIGRIITSPSAVIFALLAITSGMVMFSHTLFKSVFPLTMEPWERSLATWCLAFGWELTVLLSTVNVKYLHKHIPSIMALCSGVIVLFFIQGFERDQQLLILCQRWFVGLLAAVINYIYADLFYAKWKERNQIIDLPATVRDLESRLHAAELSIVERDVLVDDMRGRIKEVDVELNELRIYKKKVQSELTCRFCGVIHDTFGSLHAHKGHCVQNPKNKMRVRHAESI